MKFKNFLFACVGATAMLSTSVLVSSCSNDDATDADGFTPIRPTAMAMATGDVFTLGDSGTADAAGTNTYYNFTYTATVDNTDGLSDAYGIYTYLESALDARTKTITLYYNASSTNVDALTNFTTRTIVVKFTGSTAGYVYSDTGISVTDGTYSYPYGTTITFSN